AFGIVREELPQVQRRDAARVLLERPPGGALAQRRHQPTSRKSRNSRGGDFLIRVAVSVPRALSYSPVPPITASSYTCRKVIDPATTRVPFGKKYVPRQSRSRPIAYVHMTEEWPIALVET